jgi:arabinose-5-phosphate isomerase
MGDALAIALLESRGFTAEDFAFSHPGGALGRKLLLKVSDIMHQDQEVPKVTPESPLQNALLEMTEKGFGMTTIVDEKGMLLGVFTDGDLRRVIDSKINLSSALIKDVMSPNPKTINQGILAAETLNIMQQNSITAVIVEDEKKHPVGVVHMHDILRAGVI